MSGPESSPPAEQPEKESKSVIGPAHNDDDKLAIYNNIINEGRGLWNQTHSPANTPDYEKLQREAFADIEKQAQRALDIASGRIEIAGPASNQDAPAGAYNLAFNQYMHEWTLANPYKPSEGNESYSKRRESALEEAARKAEETQANWKPRDTNSA